MNANLPLLLMILVFALIGCDPADETREKTPDATQTAAQHTDDRVRHPGIDYDDGPMPGPDTVLAHAGSFQITLAEYELASRLSLLFAPKLMAKLPPERMALPHVHVTLTQSLLMQKVADDEAKKRGITVTDDEIDQYLSAHPKLSAFIGDGEAKLKPLEIDPATVREVGRLEVIKRKFSDAILEQTTKDEIWDAYVMKMDVVHALVASAKNIPSSAEIDAYEAAHPKEIDAHFAEHKRSFKIPERVTVDLLKPPSQDVSVADLQAVASDLAGGVAPDEIAAKMKWTYRKDERLLRPENKTAFDAKQGATGYEKGGPRGAYAWRVTGRIVAQEATLTLNIRREIASKLLRENEVAPNLGKRVEEAKSMMKRATPKNARKIGKKLVGLGFKNRLTQFNQSGIIEGFGLAEPVVKDAFARDKPGIGGPIRSRQEVFVYKSFDRNRADRKVFEKEYDAFRKAVLDAKRPTVLRTFMAAYTKDNPSKLNTKPLRIKYGVIQKKQPVREEPKPKPPKNKQNLSTEDKLLVLLAARAPATLLADKNRVKKPAVDLEGTIEEYVRKVIEETGEKATMTLERTTCANGENDCVRVKGSRCRPNTAPCNEIELDVVVNIKTRKTPTLDSATLNGKAIKGQRDIERALKKR